MPRTCTVCTHPDRESIDAALVQGSSFRNIAERYGTSVAAMYRHKTDHLPAHLAQAKEAAEVAHADGLLVQMANLQARTLAILTQVEQSGEVVLFFAGVAQARKNLELLAKLTGELNTAPTINLTLSSEWRVAVTALLVALAPYPDARRAAATVLAKVGDEPVSE